ncbi:hypothetical protein Tco_0026774 [Tanacetum coccineum]
MKPRRVRTMAMTIQYGVRGMILTAQSEAFKQENILAEILHGLDQQMERKGDESFYHLSIQCALFEVLYGRKCRPPVLWVKIGDSSLTGLELVQETSDKSGYAVMRTLYGQAKLLAFRARIVVDRGTRSVPLFVVLERDRLKAFVDKRVIISLLSYEAPLLEGNTSGSAEASIQLKELMKVKSLEKALKRKSKKVIVSASEGEEPEDQGRIIQDIDDDPLVSLVRESMKEKSTDFVTPTKASGEAQEEEISPTILEAAKTLSKVASQSVSKAKSTDKGKRYRRRARSMAKKINIELDAEDEINTGRVEINSGIEDVNTGSSKVDTGRTSISTSSIIHSPKKGQREGKAQMVEEDIQATHKTKEQIRQEEAGLEEAIRLQAQMDEEVAKHIHLDKMLAKRVQEEQELLEQQLKRKAEVQKGESISNDDFAKRMVEMMNEKKKFYKLTFNELKTEFEKLVKSIENFVPMETEARVKRHGLQLEQETSKKQKIDIEDASITKGKDEVEKGRMKSRRVRMMVMTIQYGVRGMILTTQSEAFKQENVPLVGSEMDEAHASRVRWGYVVVKGVVRLSMGVMPFWKEGVESLTKNVVAEAVCMLPFVGDQGLGPFGLEARSLGFSSCVEELRSGYAVMRTLYGQAKLLAFSSARIVVARGTRSWYPCFVVLEREGEDFYGAKIERLSGLEESRMLGYGERNQRIQGEDIPDMMMILLVSLVDNKGKRYRRIARSMAKKINIELDAEDEINIGRVEINSGIEDVNTGSSKVDTGRTSISSSSIIHSPKKGQREGKAQMVEEDIQATHKLRTIKTRRSWIEEAIRFASSMEGRKDWDTIRAKLEANTEVVKSLQGESISLRWKPTGRIFKIAGLRWIPTGKIFTDNPTKLDIEPPNGSNDDITNPYECDQTLNVSAVQASLFSDQMASADISSGPAPQRKERSTLQCTLSFKEEKSSYLRAVLSTTSIRLGHQLMTPGTISSELVPQPPSPTPNVPPTKNDWDSLFCPMFDEYFNPSPSVVQPVLVAVVQETVVSTGTHSSTRIDQDTPSTSTSQTTPEEQSHVTPTSVEENDQEPSFEESSSQIVIPTNVHSVNQPQKHIEKWTKDHPLNKIIGDPSRPISTRLQLQTEALFCYYDALLSSIEHKSYQDALTESCWFDAMKSSMSLIIWRLGASTSSRSSDDYYLEVDL